MRKETFIKSTIILIIGGFLTKALGMIIKIVMSRLMGSEGIGLYMLVLPTFSLLIGLCQFGIPTALSKLIAEESKNNKKLLFSLLPISLIINIIIISFVIVIAPTLAFNFLHEKRALLPILAICVVLPLTSTSSILRSYFFGKQQMLPHVTSNVLEDIIRLILIIIGVPIFISKGLEVAVTFVILTNIISELSSILVLFFFLPKNLTIKKQDLAFNKGYAKEAMNISIPSTASRLIGSFGYFLEPIILTNTLTYAGYSSNFIVTEYGVISGFVMPLLLLPSFFTMAISQALLPIISKATSSKHYDYAKKKLKQAIGISLLIGVPASTLLAIFPEFFLGLIYNTHEGVAYMRFLAPICILQYIQAPLSACLDAMGLTKLGLKATIIGTLIRTIFLLIFSLLKIGMWGLIFSTSLNVIFTTLYNLYQVKTSLKK